MSSTKAQRGPLLSSVVMVMLATAATGLLAIIGLQALPESVVNSTFGGDEPEARTVDVSDSPAPDGPRATNGPKSVSPTSTAAPTTVRTTKAPNPVRTAGTVAPTSGPTATKTTTPPKKTTSPSPTATKSPSPSPSTQAPSPAPSCGTGRKPRCPKAPASETSAPTYPGSYYSPSGSGADEAPTYSKTKAKKHAKHGKAAKSRGAGRKR